MKTAWLVLGAAAGVLLSPAGASSSCHEKALVTAGRARFCVLTERMVRMEWAAADSGFRDATTMLAQHRRAEEPPAFTVTKDGSKLAIVTKSLRLEYDAASKESFNDANLKVQLLQPSAGTFATGDGVWVPSMTDAVRADALPGTIRTLDGANGRVPLDCQQQGPEYMRDKHCTYGVMSRKRGYTVQDDSLAATFDDDPHWPWLQPAATAQPADPAACRAVPSGQRRVCGLYTNSQEVCVAQGCCFAPTALGGAAPANQADGFRCFYSATSYQDLYFFGHGLDFKGALREFTQLSGRAPVPPRFAFGVFYSRWWAYSDADLQVDIVGQYEDRGLPLDVLVIDMDWHLTFYKNGSTDQAGQSKGWTGLTWDKHLFPDPKQFLTWLHEKGVAVTLNLHPASGVQPWEDTYDEVARAMGIDPATRQYVPFRITDKKFAETWLNVSIGRREGEGVDFWWLDWQQGEDWIERVEGRRNVNPTLWLNYVFSTNPHHWGRTPARPMLLHRFGGLGNHRYPVGFSGDSFASWDTLGFQPEFTLMAANLAYGYWSHDLGGFQNAPDPELFTRWVQWGAFSPVFRTHSSKDASSDRRIWKYSDTYYAIARAAMVLRAALVPYVYSEAWTAHREGLSVLRGAFLDWPALDAAYNFTQQYLYGSQLLVAPVVTPVAHDTQLAPKSVWLPPGDWYDFHSGNVLTGPIVHSYSYALHEIPRFAKAGAIIPLAVADAASGASSVGRNTRVPTTLHLLVVPGSPKHFYELHEDDGLTKEYLAGHHASTLFDFTSSCGASGPQSPSRERVFRFGATNLAAEPSTARSTYSYCSGGTVTFNVMPVKGAFKGMPAKRAYKIEFLGALPAASVTVNGQRIKAIEFPDTAQVGASDGFSYAGATLSLTVHLNAPRDVAAPVQVQVAFITTPASFDASSLVSKGFVGKFSRLHDVKVLLDNQWHTDTVFMSDYPHLLAAAEVDRAISYDPSAIATALEGFDELFQAGAKELAGLAELHADVRAQALAYLSATTYQTNHVRYTRSPLGY
ncbi:hypothetical protein PybrP1_000052 [[Pythium] brassicae (nom. inval.)]|nr:hypothetical protein PybrP1_000052 [[Pythium] brassicae (nom. inval.)]